jgi:hypothetical protein
VGNSIVFVVTPTKLQNVSANNIRYEWSFGDGSVSQGNTVSHAYRFSGEYSVVVNAYYSDKEAVSRVLVKVVEPKLSLEKISGGLSVTNNSGSEINLGGWNLVGKTKVFNFPKDTLISNNKKIIFADEITGINDDGVRLENPLGKSYADIFSIPTVLGASIDSEKISEQIEKIKENLNTLKPEVEKISVGIKSEKNDNYQKEAVSKKEDSIQNAEIVPETVVFEAPKESSIVSKIFYWPISGIDLVRRLFIK